MRPVDETLELDVGNDAFASAYLKFYWRHAGRSCEVFYFCGAIDATSKIICLI